MAGYRSLPLAPVSATAMAAVTAQPNGPTMYHHQSMTAMSNNGIIYQSAVHASIHSLNTVQNQRSTTHHILATATATAAAAVATATARQYAATGSATAPPVPPPLPTASTTHLGLGHQQAQQQQQQQLQSSQQNSHQHQQQQQQQLVHHQQRSVMQQQQHQQHQQHLMAGHHPHHHLAQHPHHPHHHHHHPHHPHHPHAHQQIALHQNLFFSGTSLAGHAHHRQLFSHMQSAIMPLGVNGDPIKLPDNLESLPRADSFPSQRHRWNTNEEIAAILISFDKHNEWQSKEVKTRPKSGSLLLYSRKKVRYRRDGYCWKKRKDGKTTREDHMKLKVQGTECIYGCYVHSAILPTFHRRCYWLLQNPDIVLVHYLNVPYPDDNKMAVIAPSISLWGDKKEWTKEELVSQLKPMLSTVTSDDESDSGNDIEISTAETVESIVCQLMEKQRLSRQAALVKQLDCGCGDASCADGKTCTHPVMRRPSLIKATNEKRLPATNAVEPYSASNTPNVVVGPKLYSRWADKRAIRDSSNSMDTNGYQHHHGHGHHGQTQQLTQESAIKFQIIPPHNEQQQQHYRHHYNANGSNTSAAANHQQLIASRNNLIMQHQQQMHTNQSNFNQVHNQTNNNNVNHNTNNNNNGNNNLQRYTTNNNNANIQSQQQQQQQQHRFQIAKTTITAMDNNTNNQQQHNNNNLASVSSVTANNGGGLVVGGSSGEIAVDMLNTQNHSHHTMNQHSNQAMSTTNSNTNNKINHNTNINNNTTNPNSHQHANQTITTTSTTPVAVATNSTSSTSLNSNIVTTTTQPQLMSTPHHQQQQQQNELNVINNNSMNSSNGSNNCNNNNNTTTAAATTTKFNNYNQQQLNTSNNSNNNNSLNSHTANQQQKLATPQEQYYKLQHHKQQQQQSSSLTTSNTVVAASSTVEPMCMSPEHQLSSSSSSLSPQSQLNHQQIQQQQTHLIISPSDSVSESQSSISSSSLSSSSQTFMDVNQKSTNTTVVSNNSNNNNNNNIDNAQMSSNNNDLSINTSNINNNDSNNRNNQLDEYNNCNINNNDKNTTGCATSSSDASNCNNNNNNNNSITTSQQQPLNPNNQSSDNINTDNLQHNTHSTSTSSTICFDNLEQNHHGGSQVHQQQQQQHVTSELHDTLGFFNETLDLSHEDIQRTLIANMPGEGTLLTSLDFMNSSVSTAVSSGANIVQNVQCEPEPEISAGAEADDEDTDDVFANLDAFDMLVEFPELDLDDKQALTNTALEQAVSGVVTNEVLSINSSCQNLHQLSQYDSGSTPGSSCDKKVMKICDFSPDWSYPEGGVKVLVAGPWSSDAHYTVLFDSHPVPTVLVQEGVLRCYCPSHEVGYATLQVSCDGFVISDSVMFEYKMITCQEAPFDANTNDCLYKFSLYNRLTTIEETMQTKGEVVTVTASQQIFSLQGNLEEKLVSYCHQLTKMSWQNNGANSSSWNSGYKGMTLLHLAAALGYNKLVCALLNWRSENPHIILETEIDAFSQDSHGYTPLTWACSRGHLDTAILLYKWNQNALKIKNHAQQTPLDVADNKGHKNIVAEIYRLEHERQRKQNKGSLTSLSINLNKYSLNNDDADDHPSFAIFESSDSQRSHDGVFLRPVAVASNQSPPNSSRFSKRSSIDSGISMDIRTKPMKSFKDITRLHSLDAHDNFNNSIESPLDTIGTTTNSLLSPLRKMDFALWDSDAKVLTLAEHIIAAMPERIKNEADEMMVLGSPMTEPLNTESTGLNDSFMDPLLDSLPNAHFDNEFNFDFNDHNYRYHEVSTPCSSLSPASSGPLQSPASYSILGHDPSVSSPSPPPSTKQLTEFLHASSNTQYPFEADFSKLTLTDTEQRELYEAAKCIQKAYRSYKGRQKLEEQNKERTAAIVIQNYYRRYKQFAYYRQMTNAALVIQHGYRSYCRNKRFKKSQTSNHLTASGSLAGLHNTDSQDSTNSQCLSSFFDNFNKQETESSPQSCTTPKETSPSGPLKRTYSQSTQNQAARKIQQFMRQSRIKLQRERAEKEKLVHQRREEYLQNLQYQGQPEIVCPIEKSDTILKDSNELVSNDIVTNNNHDLN
ncbi:calmodulin-binding transcription activator 1 isoform X4 [Lucilia cuprina]|uniref:calmodulin-binding transcription activator 1 isoform X4 n=1 Tax=Lucilia cuprina TaxID=7375 RepID=UPI001F068446|nr:calmodulin-binding transcription activator 1 isoform X4 [Lucilia cuprina]